MAERDLDICKRMKTWEVETTWVMYEIFFVLSKPFNKN